VAVPYVRDNLRRGECGDAEHMREATEDASGVPVDSVSLRELRHVRDETVPRRLLPVSLVSW
jgi:hypothetical protein